MNKNLQEIGANIHPATDNLDAYTKEETEIDYSNENIKQLADSLFQKDGVNAQFSLEQEQLAFPIRPEKGEIDGFVIYPTPDKKIVEWALFC